jgi:hypothetical protein
MQKLIEIESPIVAMGRWVGPKTLPAIAALMGGLVFAALAGGAVIDPARLGWIAGSDAATGYLGWLFFRLAPWAWPPGGLHVAGFGPDSLVAAGSIPLLAFFFKLFSRLLPGNFQYIGLWLVACYALQGFFAYRLLALFTLRMPFLLGGVLLFVLSPILLGQLQTDPALAAQWIMLAGFYLYYANPDRGRPMAWLALLWLATLVHGYLALMVLAIWLAHAFQRRRISSTCVAFMSVALGGAAALLWLSGYFVRFGTSASRFDAGTTNAVALFSSLGQMSFRPAASAMFASGQLVNFHQLGLGVIAALVLGMATLRTHRQQRSVTDAPAVTPDRAVAMACVALTALALLPWLAWAAHRLFIAPPGDSAAALSTAIGAFGPLLWPTYYLLMLVAWRGLQRLPGRASAIALTVVLMLQLIDLIICMRRSVALRPKRRPTVLLPSIHRFGGRRAPATPICILPPPTPTWVWSMTSDMRRGSTVSSAIRRRAMAPCRGRLLLSETLICSRGIPRLTAFTSCRSKPCRHCRKSQTFFQPPPAWASSMVCRSWRRVGSMPTAHTIRRYP